MEKPSVRPVDNSNELNQMVNKLFVSPHRKGFIEIGTENAFMPDRYENYIETVKQFKVYDDDIYLTGYPKSGTRWAQEMIWLIANNLDYESAKQVMLDLRTPMLEGDGISGINYKLMDQILKLERPRVIKTHLHWSLWPEDITSYSVKPRIIIILRSPEDVCLSQYYQSKTTSGFIGTIDEFCTLFLAGKVPLGPYWSQILGIWEQKNNFEMLIIKYKKMKEDLPAVIRQVAKFLGKEYSDQEITKLSEHLSFDSMKKNESFNIQSALAKANVRLEGYNPFVRAGVVGGHKEAMTPEVIEKFEKMKKQYFGNTDITFD